MKSLADILDVGPSPADPPNEDWALLDELERAVSALSEKMRAEPKLSRDEAMLFVKMRDQRPRRLLPFDCLAAGAQAGICGDRRSLRDRRGRCAAGRDDS